MTLGVRLFVLIALAALPVFLIQVHHAYELRRQREAAIIENAEGLAGLIASRHDRIVQGARTLLIATSHLQSIREKNAPACNARLREIAEQVPELTAMAVLAPDGERWCVSLAGSPPPINLADRPYFKATMQTRTMQTSDYIVGRQTGEGSIVFTQPALSPAGEVESVVFLAYRTSVLSRSLNEPPLPPGAVVLLVGRDGVIGARWPEPERWTGRDISSSPVIRQAIETRKGSWRGAADWAGPDEFAVASAPLAPPSNLTVVAALPLTAPLKQEDAIFWRGIALTTLVFLLAAAAAMFGAHLLVVRPLRRLGSSADALARGNFSAAPATPHGIRELRDLGAHFARMAQALAERQNQLLDLVGQKEMLLREVNHRVKNSLQLVASLFSLQRSGLKDPEVRRQFDEAARRVHTIAQIHQRLYQDEKVDRIAFDVYLKELCRELQDALGGGRISIVCDASACHLETDKVIPLALIVNELVTNAFKYSYPDGRSGVIHVGCRSERGSLVIEVADEGADLPASFDDKAKGGLGTKVVTGLTRQLRAEFEVVRKEKGKSFVIRLPVSDDDALSS